jgi:hypothetical protein
LHFLFFAIQDVADLPEGALGLLLAENMPSELPDLVLLLRQLGIRLPLLPEPFPPFFRFQPPRTPRSLGILQSNQAVQAFTIQLGHVFLNQNWLNVALVSPILISPVVAFILEMIIIIYCMLLQEGLRPGMGDPVGLPFAQNAAWHVMLRVGGSLLDYSMSTYVKIAKTDFKPSCRTTSSRLRAGG